MVQRCKTLLCRLLLIVLIILGVYLLFLSEKAMGKKCTKELSLGMLRKLCALYAAGKVDGNFCHKICNSDSLQYETCFNRIRGKKVMQVKLDDLRAVIKSRYAELSEYDPLLRGVSDDVHSTKSATRFMTQKTFISLVRNRIQSTFGIDSTLSSDELLHRLLSQPRHLSEDLNGLQMNSLWTLVQQEEYLFFTYFKDISFFPQIYGTCGHWYVEEFVPPGAVLQPSISHGIVERLNSAAWEPRAKAAKDLMDIVRATETQFKEPLHLCDVKPENFGMVNSKVKAIDIDISFFDKTMGNFLEQPNCSKHEDCDFFDCHGVCNLVTKKCTRKRRNNNFQAMCKDVFGKKLGNPGLLRRPPPAIQDQVSQLLHKCIYPDEDESVAKGSTTDTFQRLYDLLTESLKDTVS